MNTSDAFIAADFGGGSGRVIAGTVDDAGKISLHEIHRFRNRQVRLGPHLYWDFPALFAEMIEGLRKAVERGFHIRSIGIDTWGVDFGFIDRSGSLLALPVCYRDEESTAGVADDFFATRSRAEHYATAGIQIMDINTLYRLARMKVRTPYIFDAASTLLFMPDLFSHFLTGVSNAEYTIATTSELIDAAARCWNYPLIDSIGLPHSLFPPIVMPGEVRGHLTESIRQHIGVDYEIPVVAVAGHDTASAAAVCPTFEDGATAFLSSGTWSLLGVTLPEPILTEEARRGGFTNEGATDRRITFLQNITGLWILQRLIDSWQRTDPTLTFSTLTAEAEASQYSGTIDVDDPVFARSCINMEREIASALTRNGNPAPITRGDVVRCVLQSLASRYASAITDLNAILPHNIERLRIIGGGSKNELLNRLTARTTGLKVETGPAEATALGNILIQARTAGLKPSLS